MKYFLSLLALLGVCTSSVNAQRSVARRWNEVILQSIREDFARPPVQARNLFHLSMAMYDAWAAYGSVAKPYLLGNTVANFTCPFNGIPKSANVAAARDSAISYAAYRVILARFIYSPRYAEAVARCNNLMNQLGYNINYTSTNYQTGGAAALGNYIGQCVLGMGIQDGSNENFNYATTQYQPVNPPFRVDRPGNLTIRDPNRWQPLTLTLAIDQNGNPIPATQVFQSPEWGKVQPFAMTAANRVTYTRNNFNYQVYHDPGPFPMLDTAALSRESEEFKWNMLLVSAWGSHHDPNDGVMWDVSPGGIGNNPTLPNTLAEYRTFYNFNNGGDTGKGRPLNPKTGRPYAPQIVPRGDYTRVLAQFWADGPNSETPPGHWYTILNYVNDQLSSSRRFNGKGRILDNLEWDIKCYFTLGGALHDAAVAAWGIKGWYDGVRPISAIRYMAGKGQSSDPALPFYHPAGIPLVPGFSELVMQGDPLAGAHGENVGKIKLYTWRGNKAITNPQTQIAGVGWVLAENWETYQRSTFVTPPFGGYISGHSTYSRAAAEAITLITGDEYFPGGMGEFKIAANSGFLGLEQGPSTDVSLQWATYTDASDQTSLSRIWGGIHPPFDDIPGRKIGGIVGKNAFHYAKTYFYRDEDQDGYLSYEDCDDRNPAIHPGVPELCDGKDNNCDGMADEDLRIITYYRDGDGDGFGVANDTVATCAATPPAGYVLTSADCNDQDATVYPGAQEVCDNKDNNCNGIADEGVLFSTFFEDKDNDGFGNPAVSTTTCFGTAPAGFAANNLDCNDTDPDINPLQREKCDGIDNNCNGLIDDGITLFTYYLDRDRDGFGGSDSLIISCNASLPTGYASSSTDCNDRNATIYPGAPEQCDGIDNNCDGNTDEGLQQFVSYRDADGDGFGDALQSRSSCNNTLPTGYVRAGTDCDDANPAVYPGATERCDGKDNDCDGSTDEGLPQFSYYRDRDGDGFGVTDSLLATCNSTLPTGYALVSGDCNDQNAAIFPGQTEVWDRQDNDCDGEIDEGTIATSEPQGYFRVYPNPVSQSVLYIEWKSASAVHATLTDVSGRNVLSARLTADGAGKMQLDLRALDSGWYYLHLTDAEKGLRRVEPVAVINR